MKRYGAEKKVIYLIQYLHKSGHGGINENLVLNSKKQMHLLSGIQNRETHGLPT